MQQLYIFHRMWFLLLYNELGVIDWLIDLLIVWDTHRLPWSPMTSYLGFHAYTFKDETQSALYKESFRTAQ